MIEASADVMGAPAPEPSDLPGGWPPEIRFEGRPRGAVDVHVVTATTGSNGFEAGVSGLDAGQESALRRLAAVSRFEGKAGQSLWVTGAGERELLLVGAGPVLRAGGLRSAAAFAAQQIHEGVEWSLHLPPTASGAATSGLQAAAEGVLLSTYRCKRIGHPTEANSPRSNAPGCCTLVAAELRAPEVEAVLTRARILCAAIVRTRDLVNAPANELGPAELADAAEQVARRHGLSCEVVRGPEVAARGFRMVAAVGRASSRPPTVSILRSPARAGTPAVALIGKGVVFDSGGLNIKGGEGMALMRKDMAGAATVLGALDAALRLGVELPFLAVLPAAENAIGPEAYRPGDVLRSYCGTTVEISNTDAEGRLLLADAIGFAREQGAPRLIDAATLTGAARTALGPEVPALFGTDEELLRMIEAAAAAHDEKVWRMPLVDEYDRLLDTPFADVNHASHDPRGGAITAALFLKRFAGATPWAHLDLYGWEDTGRPETPKGANGMLVKTLVGALERMAAAAA